MNRVVVKLPDGYCNLEADSMKVDGDVVEVYNKGKLVGVFNKVYIFCCYLSKTDENRDKSTV